MNTKILSTLAVSTILAGCTHTGMEPAPSPVEIQILALNDFHGNLEVPQRAETYLDGDTMREARLGGAAHLGAALDALREDASVTIAAGDMIGASPLISSLFLDEPSIAALTAIGLDVASVGNHEFDRGTNELRRIQDGGCEQFTRRQPCALEPFTGAGFEYLAGNVVDTDGESFFPGTSLRDVGGVMVGFIGLTLQGTPNLVADSATEGYDFLDEADTANALAAELVEDGADTVVLIIHEGAYGPQRHTLGSCPQLSGPLVEIAGQLDPRIAVVASGHTHNSYVCLSQTDQGTQRLLTSAGRYGAFITDISITFDPASGTVTALQAVNIPVAASYGTHEEAAAIVARYAEATDPVASRPVGPITGEQVHGDDCGDTPAQALVADSYLYAANRPADDHDTVDFALVNSGGVRTDLSAADDGVLSYGELAAMSPFSNTIVSVSMTGEQVYALLEQQICEESGVAGLCGSVLVPSANLTYEIDLSAPEGERVSDVVLGNRTLDRQRTYTIVTNNFLSGGGDGFSVFTQVPVQTNFGIDLDWLENYVASGTLQVPMCGRVRALSADS